MSDRFLTRKEVCARWGISRWALMRHLKTGTVRVPPAALIGPGQRLRWRESDIDRDMATASVTGDIRREALRR